MFGFINQMNGSIKGLVGTAARKWILAGAVAATLGGPSFAMAHDRYDDRGRVNVDIRIGEPCRPVYEERRVQVWVPAQYRCVQDRRWIEPVYRTVCDRVWVEPVFKTVCEKVWVPDVWETREVRRYDRHRGWFTSCERILVVPGHFETRENRVLVCDGHYDRVERQELVVAGHWETFERKDLVCEGHYETRIERVPVAQRSPYEVVNPGLHIRF